MDFTGLTLVVGAGLTGQSVVRFLLKKGIDCQMVDESQVAIDNFSLKFPGIPTQIGFSPKNFLAARTLIISPGIWQAKLPQPLPTQRVINDIELFMQVVTQPVIAVTGSNGKSTVVSLLEAVFKRAGKTVAVGGNIGTPALDVVADEVDYYILELSSFQLVTLQTLTFDTAVLLNITPDHLDWHGSLAAYRASKIRILTASNHTIVQKKLISDGICTQAGITFGSDRAANYTLDEQGTICHDAMPLIKLQDTKLQGLHNGENIMVAFAVAAIYGIAISDVTAALTHFSGLAHRCEQIAKWHDVTWFNDSKATNVGATVASLTGLGGVAPNIILILGGVAKGQSFDSLRLPCQQFTKAIIVMGEASDSLQQDLAPLSLCQVSDMEKAVALAVKLAKPGDRVLLSPACASFDMFDNFEARGESFTRYVQQLS